MKVYQLKKLLEWVPDHATYALHKEDDGFHLYYDKDRNFIYLSNTSSTSGYRKITEKKWRVEGGPNPDGDFWHVVYIPTNNHKFTSFLRSQAQAVCDALNEFEDAG